MNLYKQLVSYLHSCFVELHLIQFLLVFQYFCFIAVNFAHLVKITRDILDTAWHQSWDQSSLHQLLSNISINNNLKSRSANWSSFSVLSEMRQNSFAEFKIQNIKYISTHKFLDSSFKNFCSYAFYKIFGPTDTPWMMEKDIRE